MTLPLFWNVDDQGEERIGGGRGESWGKFCLSLTYRLAWVPGAAARTFCISGDSKGREKAHKDDCKHDNETLNKKWKCSESRAIEIPKKSHALCA